MLLISDQLAKYGTGGHTQAISHKSRAAGGEMNWPHDVTCTERSL